LGTTQNTQQPITHQTIIQPQQKVVQQQTINPLNLQQLQQVGINRRKNWVVVFAAEPAVVVLAVAGLVPLPGPAAVNEALPAELEVRDEIY
jgi:hypothetical protein